jgi:hypothetical protein
MDAMAPIPCLTAVVQPQVVHLLVEDQDTAQGVSLFLQRGRVGGAQLPEDQPPGQGDDDAASRGGAQKLPPVHPGGPLRACHPDQRVSGHAVQHFQRAVVQPPEPLYDAGDARRPAQLLHLGLTVHVSSC